METIRRITGKKTSMTLNLPYLGMETGLEIEIDEGGESSIFLI